MLVERKNIADIVRAQLKEGYAIGLHGIMPNRLDNPEDLPKDELVFGTTQNILANGLKIASDRTINGTVEPFGRSDDMDNARRLDNEFLNYNYGWKEIVVVALPVVLKDDSR